MKKGTSLSALALGLGLMFSANAFAQGGYTGPTISSITVKEALELKDDTPVVMVGQITENLGGDKYTFKDQTGSLTVEIDAEDWGGVTVGPNETVEIRGEVDKDFTSFKIDVDQVVKQ